MENIHFALKWFYGGKDHALSNQIRRSWNFASCDDSRNRRQADLAGYPGREIREGGRLDIFNFSQS